MMGQVRVNLRRLARPLRALAGVDGGVAVVRVPLRLNLDRVVLVDDDGDRDRVEELPQEVDVPSHGQESLFPADRSLEDVIYCAVVEHI